MKENICQAVMDLYQNGQIDLYSKTKSIMSDFRTDEINWSEFEEKTVDEILDDDKSDEIDR